MVKAVVGANWGDEGKGKITDMLAEQADMDIRQVVRLLQLADSVHELMLEIFGARTQIFLNHLLADIRVIHSFFTVFSFYCIIMLFIV